MNICHVNLARGFSGGEQQTIQLIRQQLEWGYSLAVVALPNSPFAQAVAKLGCKVIPAKHFLFGHMQTYLKQHQYILHVHEGRAIYWAYLHHLLHKTPYIITRRIDNPLKTKFLSTQAYQYANSLVGVSNRVCEVMAERHPQSNIVRIPDSPAFYPVEAERVAEIKQQFSGKFLVIQAANMLKHKGFDVSVAAAHRLQSLSDRIQIVLIGDGEEKTALEQQAQGLTNLTFAGRQKDMGNWFAAADLLIHPSYTEGLGSVILEAIAAGLPVIGSRAGGIPDIIDHHVSGLLFEAGDDTGLAESILTMAEDQHTREKLTQGAQQKLAEFAIAHTATQYQQLYSRAQHAF